jgi:Flagellar biosynthesis pathway, component FlhB
MTGGESAEQDRSENATPFKLDQARKKGILARGTDLGFLSSLVAVAVIAQTVGEDLASAITLNLRRSILGGIAAAQEPLSAARFLAGQASAVAALFLVPAFLLVAIGAAIEVVQNRGIVFSFEPLKADFTRLNPAAGFKRLFSMRMLKELGKSLFKATLYIGAAFLFIRHIAQTKRGEASDGSQLAYVLIHEAGRILLLFIVLAAIAALFDQLLARGEFAKQMRMSRRDVVRESREREGEPRQKRKRKQILAEILKQAAAAAHVKGADILIVNPTHFAVALRYRPEDGDAPIIQARGQNFWAQRMRKVAEREGIVIIRNPTLARALFREGQPGRPIGSHHFVAVADIYIALRRAGHGAGTK